MTYNMSISLGHELEVAQFLKFRNCESQFLLPVHEVRSWESENDSFSIPITIPLIPIPRKYAKNSQRIGTRPDAGFTQFLAHK